MKFAIFASATLALALTLLVTPISAEAKDCLKGAVVGGAAGHMVHHGIAGAVGGCIVGHHMANEKNKQPTAAENQHQSATQSNQSQQE